MDTSPPRTNSMRLRRLAEAAASCRAADGKTSYLYVGEDGQIDIMCGDAPQDIVLEVETYEVWKGRIAPGEVIMLHQGTPTKNLARKYDAVFWSESAVEKFVLPYYASLGMWDAANALRDISMAWYNTDPCHHGYRGITDETIPFALAHTPDSNWSKLPDAFDVLFKVNVEINGEIEEEIRALPVSEFLRTYWRNPND